MPMSELFRREGVTYFRLRDAFELPEISAEAARQIETNFFYEGYIRKQSELAEKMDVPVENLLATVKRYNQIVASGDDVDFGKRARLLTSVEKGPFYALKWGPVLLDVFGGAQIDTHLNVIGPDAKNIPGLYAVGNAAGGMYAVDYPLLLNGNSYGRALAYAMQLADSLCGTLDE